MNDRLIERFDDWFDSWYEELVENLTMDDIIRTSRRVILVCAVLTAVGIVYEVWLLLIIPPAVAIWAALLAIPAITVKVKGDD